MTILQTILENKEENKIVSFIFYELIEHIFKRNLMPLKQDRNFNRNLTWLVQTIKKTNIIPDHMKNELMIAFLHKFGLSDSKLVEILEL